MRLAAIQRIFGFLISLSSLMFLTSAAILLLLGLLIFLPVRHVHRDLRLHDGFMIVVGCWVALALVGALPFLLLEAPAISYVDALFESTSGFTTTRSPSLFPDATVPATSWPKMSGGTLRGSCPW